MYLTRFFRSMLVLALLLPVAVQAEIEEIVVTAQKRSESLQDVPIAVTAFTGDTMRELGVVDASDLVQLTPGLSAGSQSGSNKNYYLRGVGTNDFHLTSASAVGQYFDGITLTSGFHARAALFDMERVEVLKGPQNTLYGLNTTGGAVNYISRKPEVGADTTGSVNLNVGSDSLFNAEAAIGFGLGDTAAARIAFASNSHDGPFKSITDGRDYGDDDMQAYRASLVWEPSEKASILLNVHGMQSENNGTAAQALGSRAADGSGTLCTGFSNQILDFERNTDCRSRNRPAAGPAAAVPAYIPGVDPSTGDWETISQGLGFEDVETNGYYLDVDYDFEFATVTFITAFDNLDVEAALDNDAGPGAGLNLYQADDRDTRQHELRLVSSADKAFRWIAGIYYLDEEADSYTAGRSPNFPVRNPGSDSFNIGLLRGDSLPNVQLDHSKENLGFYAQGEYDLSDSMTLTVGLRWSDEEIEASYLPSNPNVSTIGFDTPIFAGDVGQLVQQYVGLPGFDANGYQTIRQVEQELSNEDVGYTVKFDWRVTENSLVYLSTSKGFKGGAADIRAVFATLNANNLQAGLESARLDPESLEAWELGYKGIFADNRVSFDAAAFWYTYEDLQQFVNSMGLPTLDNAPESEIFGIDGNLRFASGGGFYLDLGFSYLDTEVTDGSNSVFVEGTDLAHSPELSFSVLATQEFQLSNGSALALTANLTHTDDYVTATGVNNNVNILDLRSVDDVTLVNARVSYRFGEGQKYAVALFGRNLTDEQYCGSANMDGGNNAITNNQAGFHQNATCRVTRASTRTYGASFSVEF